MLELAIISTVLLGSLIIMLFATALVEDVNTTGHFILIIMLGFVLMSVWFLYAR